MLPKRAAVWFIGAAFVCQPLLCIEQAHGADTLLSEEVVEEVVDCLSGCRLDLKSCHKDAEKAFPNGEEAALKAALLTCGEDYEACVRDCIPVLDTPDVT